MHTREHLPGFGLTDQQLARLALREMPLSDLCCGSAGIYNVLHPEMSQALLDKKIVAVDSTRADIVATANPGCMLQLRSGTTKPVAHVIELLDHSYQGTNPLAKQFT